MDAESPPQHLPITTEEEGKVGIVAENAGSENRFADWAHKSLQSGAISKISMPKSNVDRIEGLHEWVHCPHTVRTPLLSVLRYAHTFQLTEIVDIPGSGVPPATTTTTLPRVLILLRHWLDVILRMHRSGYSLRGDFSADNFVIVNYNSTFPEVRLTGSICLSKYDEDIASMDYYFLASSVERFFGARGEVPHHIQEWLHLVARGVCGLEYAIRYHPGLMVPRQAFQWTMSLRRILEQTRHSNRRLYRRIMRWCSGAHQGLREHPAVNYEEFMIFIAEQDFPRLVAGFHLLMFKAGLVQRLRPETTMG
ncbi:uncharacterized protein C2845_PM13G00510 [Panicum miliaceum]|uniref:Uncharacterized protein n=1 Tax=Panicum miliaceum TaxID=4540 RepID=A0A3L6RIE8_PANMI|nr:uncharacterized protein C2845_PM13G00510 [Panicum miliaceum]